MAPIPTPNINAMPEVIAAVPRINYGLFAVFHVKLRELELV